jgi:hypothetical protein
MQQLYRAFANIQSTRNSCAGARHAMFMYITCAQIAEHEMVFQSCNVQRGLAAGERKKRN